MSKEFVMRTRSLEDGKPGTLTSNDEPVASIGDMALPASRPLSLEVVHVVPTAQLGMSLGSVLEHEANDLFERCKVNVLLFQAL